MRYRAVISHEGRQTLAEFPDAPGCQTFADPGESIDAQAAEALDVWLEGHLANGRTPPRPAARRWRVPKGATVIEVVVPLRTAAAVALRWAREDSGLTQSQLARKLRVSQPQIAKLEDPNGNPTLDTVEKVALALGLHADLSFAA